MSDLSSRLRGAGPPPAPLQSRPERVRIATRGSDLARWQAQRVATALAHLNVRSELVAITTTGDLDQRPFASLPGAGFFVKSVQEAVLDGRADMAVHSFKDLPSSEAPGLELAATFERADPRDLLLARPEAWDDAAAAAGSLLPLRTGVTLGTSAVRRRDQAAHHRPDLQLAELRGNVPTRIAKLRSGEVDAVLIAAAGVRRLQLDVSDLHAVPLDPERFLPAPAQGALALEVRRDDAPFAALATELHDHDAHHGVAAERGLMAWIRGGCQLSLGAHARRDDDGALTLFAWYDGRTVQVRHPRPEEAAMLAFAALGRPDPSKEREGAR